MSIPVLSEDDLPAIAEPLIQAAVREAFRALGQGHAVQPPQMVMDLPGGGDVITYQAAVDDVICVKVSPYLPQANSPAIVTAWTLLMSATTGEPLLLVDSKRLTTERTAATTALAVDLLARPDARRLVVVGTGPAGQAHLRHVRAVRTFEDVVVHDRSGVLDGSAQQAAEAADVVLLCTSAAEPVIDVSALSPGTLVTSISTNAPMAHEIDPGLLRRLDVYADLASAACAAAGEMRLAEFTVDDIRGDLPGLLTGTAPRPTGDKVVFFRSVGLGIEDAAVAVALTRVMEQS